MKFRLLTYMFILLFSSTLLASNKIAIILKAKGPVTIEKASNKKKVSAKKGMSLEDGDKIVTGKRAFAAVRFLDDKSLVRVRANSVCSIEGKKKDKKIEKSIFVEIGTFFCDIFKQKGSFKVITPTSVASIKGTKFWTIHSANGGSRYVGIEGLVEIKNEKGKALMKKGETAIVESKDSPPLIRLTKKGDLPEDADDIQGEILEVEFESKDGQQKSLRIEMEKNK